MMKSACYNFPKPKMMNSNRLFYSTAPQKSDATKMTKSLIDYQNTCQLISHSRLIDFFIALRTVKHTQTHPQ